MFSHRPTRAHRRAATLVGAIALLLAASATPALATYPEQSTTLTGPAINGVVPNGQATVKQCQLPKKFGTLSVSVQSVNLPDGTTLTVVYNGQNLGSFELRSGAGGLSTNLGTQAGPNDSIIVAQGSTTILSNPGRWSTSYTCH